MDTGPLESVLTYKLGNFIFDFWQALLLLALCTLTTWLMGWGYKRHVRAQQAVPALSFQRVAVAFALAAALAFTHSEVFQIAVLVVAIGGTAVFERNRNTGAPFWMLLLAMAAGALIGFGYFAISVVFAVIVTAALAFQRKPTT